MIRGSSQFREGPGAWYEGLENTYSYGDDYDDFWEYAGQISLYVSQVTDNFPYMLQLDFVEYQLIETVEDPGGERFASMELTGETDVRVMSSRGATKQF